MTATDYARKRAAGLCAYGPCANPATDGTLCATHREKARGHTSKSQRAAYLRKKVAGVCVAHGCRVKAADSLLCHRHQEEQTARKKRFHGTARGREQGRKAQARARKRRIALDLCMRCNRPRVTKLLCEEHRRQLLDSWRKRTGWVPKRKETCSTCGQAGHRASGCRRLPALPTLRIEDFALARTEAV